MKDKRQPLIGWILVALAAVAFIALMRLAWQGALGLQALVLLLVSGGSYLAARGRLPAAGRASADTVAKAVFTVAGIMALLRHRIDAGDGNYLPIYEAITQYIQYVDTRTFLLFAVIAMAVKFSGVITSAFAWHLLLKGQGIVYPFWSAIMTAFLIGRFIGTFLPSTIGLDGYTLFEAGRYSNHWSRCVTAKALEKFVGITGLFLGMLVTLPFGYQVIVDVTAQVGRPDAAPMLAAAIGGIAGSICLVVVVTLVWPTLLTATMGFFGRFLPGGIRSQVEALSNAVGAYRGQVGLLFLVLFSKFITHFTTAAVYYFTALAIGVTAAHFWSDHLRIDHSDPGDGAVADDRRRRSARGLPGPAVVETARRSRTGCAVGGARIHRRRSRHHVGRRLPLDPQTRLAPNLHRRSTAKQVDYAWIDDDEDAGFSPEKVAAATR